MCVVDEEMTPTCKPVCRIVCCLLGAFSVEALNVFASDSSAEAADKTESGNAETVTMKDVAIGIVSGREEYFKPVASAMLRYAPRGTLLRAEGQCSCNFRMGFAALLKKHPDAKWYYVADDDVIIMMDRLLKMLREFGETRPTVLSGRTQATYKDKCGGGTMAAPWSAEDSEGSCMFGGTGMIMSAPMVRQIKWDEPCKCDLADSDLELTCFLGRSWNTSFRFETLTGEKGFGNLPHYNDLMAQHPVDRLVVIHHVRSETLLKISDRNSVLGNATRSEAEVLADAVPLKGACCGKPPDGSLIQHARDHGGFNTRPKSEPMFRRESP